jgi:hypothetical protein
MVLLSLASLTAFAQTAPQTFTLDGTLYSDTAATTPLVASGISFEAQILDPTQTCVLYDEIDTIDTSLSDGKFTVLIGAPTSGSGATKRGTTDSGHSMATVYSNTVASVTGKLLSNGTACTYTPVSGDQKYVRLAVTPPSGTQQVFSPNFVLDSAPSAITAERADNIQGLLPANLLQVNTTAPANLSQANLENIFSVTNYPKLTSVLAGGSVSSVSDGTAAAPGLAFSGDSGTGFYDASAGVIGISSGGTEVFNISSGSFASTTIGGALITSGNGTAAAPTFSFEGDPGTGWFRPAASRLAASTGGAERVRIDNNGNVGIGTTSPAYAVDVLRNGSGSAGTTGILNLAFSAATNTQALQITQSNGGGDGQPASALFKISNAGFNPYFNFGDQFLMDHTGKVGIGTNAPAASLEVDGGNSGPALGYLHQNVATNYPTLIVRQDVGGGNGSQDIGLVVDVQAQTALDTIANFRYWNSGTPISRLVVQTGGNVGIGTTVPMSTLDVQGTDTVTGATSASLVSATSMVNPSANQTTGASGANNTALSGSAQVPSSATNAINTMHGTYGESVNEQTSQNIYALYGVSGWAYNETTSTVGTVAGSSSESEVDGGTVSWLTSSYNWSGAYGGVINSWFGIRVDMDGYSGTVFSRYGVFLSAPTGTLTPGYDYGFYQEGTQNNYFAGNVGIGTTSPQATIDINGTAHLAANSSQPVACSAAVDGNMARTSHYTFCVCKGGSTSWVSINDGATACTW